MYRLSPFPCAGCAFIALAGAPAASGASVETPAAPATVDAAPATPAFPAGPRSIRRLVFVCATPGLTTFSDRPCGPAPTRRELRLDLPSARGGEAASLRPAAPLAATRPARTGEPDRSGAAPDTATPPDPASDPEAARRKQCEHLERAVVSLSEQMRTGYSAREAARLWQRWREAKARLREAECQGSG
jgi:hypothetical protein